MKNIFIFVIASLAYTSTFGQLTTTEEEYNYLQKGYHTDLESGRDLKEGYDVDELGKWTKSIFQKLCLMTVNLKEV